MFLFGISFYLVLFTFLFGLYPLTWRGLNNIQSAILISSGFIALGVFESFFTISLGALWFGINKLIKSSWLTVTLLWIIMEWLQGLGSLGFPWSRLINSQYNNSYIIQSVSLFGSLFGSAIIVLANSLIAMYLGNNTKVKYIIAFFTVFILNFGYGYFRLENIKIPDNKLKVSAIQANVSSINKWDNSYLNDILDLYVKLTEIADNNSNDDIDIVVWAETALPINLNNNSVFLDTCYNLSKTINSNLLIGAFEKTEDKLYNAIYKISHSDNDIETYHKQHIVPFGEYIPFRKLLEKNVPILKHILTLSDDLNSGINTKPIKVADTTVANLICFDSIFPETARKQVLNGAELIAIQTNDSWFDNTTAVRQHLAQAVIRAVENKRFVIRSANTGISAIISPTGEILSALNPQTAGYINYEINPIKEKTVYTEFGDIIVFISMLLLIFISFIKTAFEVIFEPIINKLKRFFSIFK